MIKATRVGYTVICVIGEKICQKTVDSDAEVLKIYEQALNTDENNPEEVKALSAIFFPELTYEEEKELERREKLMVKAEEQKELLQWIEDIKNLGDEHFEVKGIKLYMKGISITVPEFLASEFAKRRNNEEDLNSLMNFWRLCALNPDPRCREDLYGFLRKNDISITPSGYFVTYRNVKIKEQGNRQLNDFVAKKWLQVKKWKKSPDNYQVYQDADESYVCFPLTKPVSDMTIIGVLGDLYDELTSGGEGATIYTDAHTRTFTIRLGEVVSMDRKSCDANPDRTCSKGLHLGNLNFMRRGSFGEQGIVCLCNPMDVVAVPTSYDGKMRTSSYLPISLAEYNDDGEIIPVDTATFEYEYAEHTQEQLEEMLENTDLESLKEHEIIPKELLLASFKTIVKDLDISLTEMNKTIQNRIVNV
jgi:hypothetical protein